MNLDKASASWPVSIELSTVCFGSRMVFLMDRELLRRTWQNIGSRLVVAFVDPALHWAPLLRHSLGMGIHVAGLDSVSGDKLVPKCHADSCLEQVSQCLWGEASAQVPCPSCLEHAPTCSMSHLEASLS
jgi:hypothetical protein